MREIKFRVWIPNEGAIGYAGDGYTKMYFLEDGLEVWAANHNRVGHPAGPYDPLCWYKVNDAVIMQYTGLKDKNGVEIYEGDIVRLINQPSCMYAEHMQGVGVVNFNEDDLQFVWGGYGILTWGRTESIEVIGNIHHHPHLLKSKK